LDERVEQEVEEFMREITTERMMDRLTAPEGLQRILTKEDCLTLFRATGVPASGPLWGVWRWAANLGEAQFNFEEPADVGDYSFLNAYDDYGYCRERSALPHSPSP
jgi:hypothetical protein